MLSCMLSVYVVRLPLLSPSRSPAQTPRYRLTGVLGSTGGAHRSHGDRSTRRRSPNRADPAGGTGPSRPCVSVDLDGHRRKHGREWYVRAPTATGVVILGVIAILAGVAAPAEAQDVPALQGGTEVWVTTGDGGEQKGAVVAISSTELVLRIDGSSRSIALADVRRIEGIDSVANGVRNGGFVGAAVLGGFGAFLSYGLCDIPDGCLPHDFGPIAVLAGLGAGAGMAAGAVIDWAIKGRRLLYAPPGTSFVLEVTPNLRAHAVGVSVVVTWRRDATRGRRMVGNVAVDDVTPLVLQDDELSILARVLERHEQCPD